MGNGGAHRRTERVRDRIGNDREAPRGRRIVAAGEVRRRRTKPVEMIPFIPFRRD
jgi:hypothetical protein